MSSYKDWEILGGDIDWFIMINQVPFHVASDGGLLPNIIKNNKERNEENFRIVRGIKSNLSSEDMIVNSELSKFLHLDGHEEYYSKVLSTLFPDEPSKGYNTTHDNLQNSDDIKEIKSVIQSDYITKVYTKAYLKFALKGFVSMDKSYKEGPEDQQYYHWVVKPKNFDNSPVTSNTDLNLPDITIDNDVFNTLIDDNHPSEINLIEIINNALPANP